MIKRIALTEWAPDQEDLAIENAFQLDNGVPVGQGYCGVRTLDSANFIAFPGAIDKAAPLGAASFIASTGLKYTFIGFQEKLYRIKATDTIQDGTRSVGGDYSTGARTNVLPGSWDFAQWNDFIIATNYADEVQIKDIGDGSLFANMITSTDKPQGRTIAVSRNFVILGDISPTFPDQVRWSALGDETDFDVDASTQSDFTNLEGAGGRIVKLYGGEYVTVMRERSILRMDYVGAPTIWQFNEVVPGIGQVGIHAGVQVKNSIFFLSAEGFYELRNGSELIPIGKGKVDEWFLNKARVLAGVTGTRQDDIMPILRYTVAAHDPTGTRIAWAYATDATTYNLEAVLYYDYSLNKWGHTDFSVSAAVSHLAAVWGTGSEETLGMIWPSSTGTSTPRVYLFDSHTSGHNVKIETGWLELTPGRSSMTKSVEIGVSNISDVATSDTNYSITLNMIGRKTPRGAASTATFTGNLDNSRERYSLRKNARFHKVSLDYPAPSIVSATTGQDAQPKPLKYVDIEYVPTHWR